MRPLQDIREWLARRFHLLPRTACAALLLLSADRCLAQPPGTAETRTVEGKVQRLTTAPRGEVDGALLDDGSSLHWPPHLQDRFARVVVEGQRVRATGRSERAPGGELQFEVDTVTNTQSSVSASNPDFAVGPAGPPPGPRGRGRRGPLPPPAFGPGRAAAVERGESEDVQGIVTRFTTAPRGELDGAVLDNGTWLHWPPHMADRFASVAKAGDKVRAIGRTETGPEGDTHFEVETITNTRTNSAVANPDFAVGPPPGPRGRVRPLPPHLAAQRRLADLDCVPESAVNGKVQRLTTAPRGEIDGAILDSGTWLHWPPHLQGEFAAAIKVGDPVRATGQMETGPAGDAHFEVQSVTNTRTDQTVYNPESPVVASSRPDSRRPDAASDRARRLEDLERQIEQMQRELKRLRSEK